MDSLEQIVDNSGLPANEILDAFYSKCKERTFAKDELIKLPHSVEKYLSILVDGVVAKLIYANDKEYCVCFCFKNEFCSDYPSFVHQKESPTYLKAITEVKLLSISFLELEELYNSNPSGNKIGKMATELIMIEQEKQVIDLLTLSAEQRYKNMLENHPEVFLHIPLNLIAGYLGIAPESLSRIRKQLVEKEKSHDYKTVKA